MHNHPMGHLVDQVVLLPLDLPFVFACGRKIIGNYCSVFFLVWPSFWRKLHTSIARKQAHLFGVLCEYLGSEAMTCELTESVRRIRCQLELLLQNQTDEPAHRLLQDDLF